MRTLTAATGGLAGGLGRRWASSVTQVSLPTGSPTRTHPPPPANHDLRSRSAIGSPSSSANAFPQAGGPKSQPKNSCRGRDSNPHQACSAVISSCVLCSAVGCNWLQLKVGVEGGHTSERLFPEATAVRRPLLRNRDALSRSVGDAIKAPPTSEPVATPVACDVWLQN